MVDGDKLHLIRIKLSYQMASQAARPCLRGFRLPREETQTVQRFHCLPYASA